MELLEVVRIEEVGRLVQEGDVLLPCLDGVDALADADGLIDLAPEACDGLILRKLGEDLLRPALRRHRDDAPGVAVVHEALAVLHERRASRLIGQLELLRVDVAEDLGITRRNRDERRALRRVVLVERSPPFGELREERFLAALIADVRELLITPAHDDIMRACRKGLLRDCARERCAFNRRIDDENLVLLQIDAHAHDEVRISSQ